MSAYCSLLSQINEDYQQIESHSLSLSTHENELQTECMLLSLSQCIWNQRFEKNKFIRNNL
jgi:hypothetical protein